MVWSEHFRDYRRSILKTQFADVLIVLYPQPSGLCRVHIISKPKVGRWWWADGGGRMVVGRWGWADGGGQMVVGRWWWADGGGQVVVVGR